MFLKRYKLLIIDYILKEYNLSESEANEIIINLVFDYILNSSEKETKFHISRMNSETEKGYAIGILLEKKHNNMVYVWGKCKRKQRIKLFMDKAKKTI